VKISGIATCIGNSEALHPNVLIVARHVALFDVRSEVNGCILAASFHRLVVRCAQGWKLNLLVENVFKPHLIGLEVGKEHLLFVTRLKDGTSALIDYNTNTHK